MFGRCIIGVREVSQRSSVTLQFTSHIDYSMSLVEYGECILSECLIVDGSGLVEIHLVAQFATCYIPSVSSRVAVGQIALIGQDGMSGVAVGQI